MADRILKSDSGNDTVIQNNSGSRKIKVTDSGDVEVTGDLKATTVKATNLKANDGTASLEIANSSGDIGFSGNTDAKIKLPSAGGLYESDGSTEILTESSGAVSLKNTILNSNVVFPAGGTGNAISIAIVYEQLSNGTDAGDATSGSWQKRNINTEISDTDSIVSIGTDNKITLGAGSYFFQFGAGAYKVGQHQTRLYNTTGSATVAMGTSAYGDSGVNIVTPSIGFGYHAPTSSNVYELNHRFQDDKTGNGLGVANSFGINEVYSFIVIYKLK